MHLGARGPASAPTEARGGTGQARELSIGDPGVTGALCSCPAGPFPSPVGAWVPRGIRVPHTRRSVLPRAEGSKAAPQYAAPRYGWGQAPPGPSNVAVQGCSWVPGWQHLRLAFAARTGPGTLSLLNEMFRGCPGPTLEGQSPGCRGVPLLYNALS